MVSELQLWASAYISSMAMWIHPGNHCTVERARELSIEVANAAVEDFRTHAPVST